MATYRRRAQQVEATRADRWTEVAGVIVEPGDYLVTGEDGGGYPLAAAVFEVAYELVPGHEEAPPAETPEAEAPLIEQQLTEQRQEV